MRSIPVKFLFVFLAAMVIVSCSKDQYTTKPQLSFKSVNTTTLVPNGLLSFTLEATDKEGDIQDSIFIQKITRNCTNSFFALKYPMPDFVPRPNIKADVVITFAYGLNLGYPAIQEPQCQGRNDSCFFRFVIQDKAGNRSDTIRSPEIAIIKR